VANVDPQEPAHSARLPVTGPLADAIGSRRYWSQSVAHRPTSGACGRRRRCTRQQ
jgi:hypothetical protein